MQLHSEEGRRSLHDGLDSSYNDREESNNDNFFSNGLEVDCLPSTIICVEDGD